MKAISEIRLMREVQAGISASTPRNESGMPRLTQSASRSRRNSARTITTNTKPVLPAQQGVEAIAQETRVVLRDRERDARRQRCFGAVEVALDAWPPISSALCWPTRKTCTSTAGRPSKRETRSPSSKPSTTVGDVSEGEPRAVAARDQGSAFEVGTAVGLSLGAQQDLPAGRCEWCRRAGRETSGAPLRRCRRSSGRDGCMSRSESSIEIS